MTKSLVIYRCCDRPGYVEQTFPQLVANTNPASVIFMADNSSDEETIAAHKAIFKKHAPPNALFYHFGSRIGVWEIVYRAIEWYVYNNPAPLYVMIADDDCFVPESEHPWDYLLECMLESDLWDVVGCAEGNDPCTPHPVNLDPSLGPWPEGRHPIRGYNLKGEGLARGRVRRFVGGACSGFRYDLYRRTIDPVEISLFWFNNWTAKYAGDPEQLVTPENHRTYILEDGRCGHFAGYPLSGFMHLDAQGPHSLKDEYKDYSNWMDGTRGRGAAKRKGLGQ